MAGEKPRGIAAAAEGRRQMGLNEDITLASKQALREMIDFLMKNKGLSKDDAYMLCSVAGDLNLTQVVDGTRGAHMLLPKSIFKKQKAK